MVCCCHDPPFIVTSCAATHRRVRICLQKGLFGGLALGTHATIQLEFKRADRKPVKAATIKGKGTETEQLPLFTNKDSIVGEVRAQGQLLYSSCWDLNTTCAHVLQIKVANTPGKKVEHQGIRVQLLGQIELKTERGSPQDFLALGDSDDTLTTMQVVTTPVFATSCTPLHPAWVMCCIHLAHAFC